MTNMSPHKTTSSYDGGGDRIALGCWDPRVPVLDKTVFVIDDDLPKQHRVHSLPYRYLKSRIKTTQTKSDPIVCKSKLRNAILGGPMTRTMYSSARERYVQ